jgi:3-hydroxybutyryl-CoA dehydrogenase
MPAEIKHIAVVGAGTMGQGIAQVCANAGYTVVLYDVQPDLPQAALLQIQKNFNSLVDKGKLEASQRDEAMARIEVAGDFRQLEADLVIEAVIEKLEVKQKIFSELEKINAIDSILTSNTSSIPITQIASALRRPERFAGLHFFNPAPVMKLVEIIRGVATADATADALRSFSERIGKVAVMAQDSPGFIVNRVARHYYVESLRLLEEGVAGVETIDRLMRESGFRMGPFELMDLIGIDTNFSVTKSMFHAFHEDPKFRPSRIQQQKVDAGHHGRKSGKGFYVYPQS